MKLKALEQIHVSAVQADTLRPGEEFEVHDDLGNELLMRHPARFQKIAETKAKKTPPNKAAADPENKTAG